MKLGTFLAAALALVSSLIQGASAAYKRTLVVGLMAFLVLVAAGCGGGGSTTTTSASLSKAQFIKQADAICEQADKAQIVALTTATKGMSSQQLKSPAVQAEVGEKGLQPLLVEAEEIAELGAPQGDEAKIAAIVEGIEKAVEKSEGNPTVIEVSFAPVNKLAALYGFKACSEAE